MTRRRYVAKNRRRQEAEGPTLERLTKGDIITQADTIDAGVFVHVNQTECLLDRMFFEGELGDREHEGIRRHKHGIWLRDLHSKLYHSDGVGSYGHRVRTTGGMSDKQYWNYQCFIDTQKAMREHWAVLQMVCCHNSESTKSKLLAALDALADHREGV